MDIHVTYNIRDFLYGTPSQMYSLVVQEINDKFSQHPICNRKCRWKPNICDPYSASVLCRYTHTICNKCDDNPVSIYGHQVCHKCATESEFPVEFEYHHQACF